MPELERALPEYKQIYDYFAREISEGRLRDRQRVPSAREIAKAWGTSVMTANRALDLLKTGGSVERSRRGTFVTSGRLVPGPQARLAFTQLPPAERIEVRAAGELQFAPRYTWPLLGLEPVRMTGECHVVRREQVHYDTRDQPFILMVDWVHPEFTESCPELLDAAPLPEPGGPAALIEAREGIRVTHGWESHEVRYPQDDGREMPLLRLGPDEPVLGQVWSWLRAGRTLVYTEMVLPRNRVIETFWEIPESSPGTG